MQLEPVELSSTSRPYKIQDETFPDLREATITPFLNSETEMVLELAEIILSKAPLLERLTIRSEMKDL